MSKKVSNKITFTELRDLLGIPKFDEDRLSECVSDMYHEVYTYEKKNGRTEEEAEAIAMEEESKEYGRLYNNDRKAVLKAAEIYFGYHNLNVEIDKKDCDVVIITPKNSWSYALKQIIQTINGHGMWEFKNLKQFLRSGPYTARTGTLTHLHWLHWWGDIYGDVSPKELYYKELD